MVFGGFRMGGGRFGRRGPFGGGGFGNPYGGNRYGGYGYGPRGPGYGRGGGGSGCARNACLLESGCCIGEMLDGNCLVLSLGLMPQLVAALVRGHGPASKPRSAGARSRLGARLIAAIGVYQQQISPRLAGTCRFEPTCSQYAAEAIGTHGSMRGTWLTARRLVRCRPGGRRGLDPVPT